MQRILSYMRKAIEDYNMIEENDKIAISIILQYYCFFVKLFRKTLFDKNSFATYSQLLRKYYRLS